MADIFSLSTAFDSIITPAQAGTGTFVVNGRVGQGVMVGLDGNSYVIAQGGGVDPNHYLLDIEEDATYTISRSNFQSDITGRAMGVSDVGSYNLDVVLEAPGTAYFWAIGFLSTSDVSFYVVGVLYKIIDKDTVVPVGGLYYRTEGASTGNQEKYYGIGDDYVATQVIGGKLLAIAQVHSSAINRDLPGLLSLPLGEINYVNPTEGSWSSLWTDLTSSLGRKFFDYYEQNETIQGLATIVPYNSTYGILINVNQAAYDYMAAHPGHNTTWDTLTGPSILWKTDIGLSFSDVTTQFGLSDIKTHLDGSPSSNYYDDYSGPNSFSTATENYVVFCRSYTSAGDLAPVGTYAHVVVYSWDGATATVVFDDKAPLFDPVADCGVDEANRFNSYPQFLQGGYNSTDGIVKFIWYGQAGSLHFDYVFGDWILVTPVEPPPETDVFVTFADLHDVGFRDWKSADDTSHLGETFTSHLDPYYFMTDDDMLWMQTPYVNIFTTAAGRGTGGVSLFMEPFWDWAEDAASHKVAAIMQVYRSPYNPQTVSVSKNKIRGKGRAVQLHFFSEDGKDFNLLGWNIEYDRNAQP